MKPRLLTAMIAALMLGLASLTAMAADQAPQPGFIPAGSVLLPYAAKIPLSIEKRGIRQLGQLDLDRLVVELRTVDWWFLTLGFPAGSGGKRSTGLYYFKKHQVIMGVPGWQETPAYFRTLIALHEGLGAAGYDDENYQISASLWILEQPAISDTEVSEILNPASPSPIMDVFNSIVRRTEEPRYVLARGGGATGVGGGGDSIGAGTKALLLLVALKNLKGKPRNLALARILATEIEPELGFSAHLPGISYSQPKVGPELVKISMLDWLSDSQGDGARLLPQIIRPIFLHIAQEAGALP